VDAKANGMSRSPPTCAKSSTLQGVRYALERPHLLSLLVLRAITGFLRRRPCLAHCLITE
jgi:hypothetical protein